MSFLFLFDINELVSITIKKCKTIVAYFIFLCCNYKIYNNLIALICYNLQFVSILASGFTCFYIYALKLYKIPCIFNWIRRWYCL